MVGRVLVTGASGFVGGALCSALLARGRPIRAATRFLDSMPMVDDFEVVAVGELGAQTDWSAALKGVDCIIHCAALTQMTKGAGVDVMAAFHSVNVAGTQHLAEQAAASGVRRMVFLSSIKVHGEQTVLGDPFHVGESQYVPPPLPWRGGAADPYALSKREAEQALWMVSSQTSLEVVVVRPPLVYGPGVKGNLLQLLRWVARGVPLPLGSVQNRRSLVGLSNLVDLLVRCADQPDAAGETFLASDGHDLSTPQLIRLIAEGMNRPAYLLPVPVPLIQFGSALLGMRRELDRLVGSLQVNSGRTRAQLGWTPPVSVGEGVREMGRWYVKSQGPQF